MPIPTPPPAGSSAPDLLALHGVRVLGFSSPRSVAGLYGLDPAEVEDHLLDAEAFGWVRRTDFAGQSGWSLTDRGRAENERRLAAEVDAAGVRDRLEEASRRFAPLNERLGRVMTQWQLRPTPQDPLARNDHRDARYDDAAAARMFRLGEEVAGVTALLSAALPRFAVHQPRIDHAVSQIRAVRNAWVDSPELPSLHTVWIQLHEDLLASLGLARG